MVVGVVAAVIKKITICSIVVVVGCDCFMPVHFGTASDSLGFRVSQPYPMNRYNLRLGCLRGSRVSNLQLWD